MAHKYYFEQAARDVEAYQLPVVNAGDPDLDFTTLPDVPQFVLDMVSAGNIAITEDGNGVKYWNVNYPDGADVPNTMCLANAGLWLVLETEATTDGTTPFSWTPYYFLCDPTYFPTAYTLITE